MTIAVGVVVGVLFGGSGPRRVGAHGRPSRRWSWGSSSWRTRSCRSGRRTSRPLRGRPIPTFGDRTPNLGGNYWVGTLDSFTHLLLPTLTLILIAFAAYTRYSRSSMLEVMSQDYIRTARAKGLPERVVVVRHGFRNTLIPLATIVPIDVITLIGGAVITEAVFARPGMGHAVRPVAGATPRSSPVMAYLLITATLAIVANIVADIVYAVVDPRIRLDA